MANPLSTRKPRTVATGAQGEAREQHVAFTLQGESYAVAIHYVQEILPIQDFTGVPLQPDWVRGVINLRGAVVPVLDLAVRFGRPATELGRRTCIVILEVPQETARIALGILVDGVSEVLDLGPSDLEPAPRLGAGPRSDFIAGIAKVRAQFVILLDVARILSAAEVSRWIQDVPAGSR
jgi:purine-binding chemotaxis protein CheW